MAKKTKPTEEVRVPIQEQPALPPLEVQSQSQDSVAFETTAPETVNPPEVKEIVVELPPYEKPLKEVALPKPDEGLEIATPQAVESSKVELDRAKFYRLCEALVTNKASQFSGFAAVRRIGEMFGITVYQEQLKKWEEIKEFLSKNPH